MCTFQLPTSSTFVEEINMATPRVSEAVNVTTTMVFMNAWTDTFMFNVFEAVAISIVSFATMMMIIHFASHHSSSRVKHDLLIAMALVLLVNIITWNAWGVTVYVDPLFWQVQRLMDWCIPTEYRPSRLLCIGLWSSILFGISAPVMDVLYTFYDSCEQTLTPAATTKPSRRAEKRRRKKKMQRRNGTNKMRLRARQHSKTT